MDERVFASPRQGPRGHMALLRPAARDGRAGCPRARADFPKLCASAVLQFLSRFARHTLRALTGVRCTGHNGRRPSIIIGSSCPQHPLKAASMIKSTHILIVARPRTHTQHRSHRFTYTTQPQPRRAQTPRMVRNATVVHRCRAHRQILTKQQPCPSCSSCFPLLSPLARRARANRAILQRSPPPPWPPWPCSSHTPP